MPGRVKKMYRDADFDRNEDVRSTTSCFAGVKEAAQFLPRAGPKLRRTSSADDVSRFCRHFELARRHCGVAFTWRHYATLLHDGFRHFKAPKGKSIHTICSTSTVSAYATAQESDASSYYSMKKVLLSNLRRCCLQISAETKHLAREVVKAVDRVLNLTPRSGGAPKRKKNKTLDTPKSSRCDSTKIGKAIETTRSDSESSSSSIRPPCGAGDIGNRKRIFRQYKRK